MLFRPLIPETQSRKTDYDLNIREIKKKITSYCKPLQIIIFRT